MTELQQAIFTALSQDTELLNLLDLLDHDNKVEISKRIVPTPPLIPGDDVSHLVHFRFPPSALASPLMDRRPVQFRIWSTDGSLVRQQKLCRRIQQILLGDVPIQCRQYSEFFYIGEGEIPGVTYQRYGWFLELSILTHVQVVQ